MGPIGRRDFLAGMLALGGTVAIASCSNDEDDPGDERADAPGETPEARLRDPGLAGDPFTLGVASGDPAPGSVILWTRLAVDPLAADGSGGMPDEDLEVRWEISEDAGFSTLVASGDAPATAALGHSVHVDARGLRPDRWYQYRFRIGPHTSPTGRTRAAPGEGDDAGRLTIAVASCQDFANGYYGAHRAIAADDLDLVVFLGDYIYEGAGPSEAVRPFSGPRCVTLGDYRTRYALYRSDPDLRAAHARCPWVLTWDDHEVENNYAALASERGTTPAEFAEQRAAAYQAYYENQPLRLDPPEGANWQIRRALRWGTLAELFMLDGRQYRDDQPCERPDDALVDRAVCDPAAQDRSMLGEAQERWLTDGLSASGARWKLIGQQTVMSALVLGNTILNVDQWDGYPRARARLLAHLDDHDVHDVVVLTGDIHAAGASVLRTDSADPSSSAVAVEVVCTSITSAGLAQRVGIDPTSFDPTILGLAYGELVHHGYTRCTCTPQGVRIEFVIVDDVADPASAVSVDATFDIPAGRAELVEA